MHGSAELANAIYIQGRTKGPYGYGLGLRFGYLHRLSGDAALAPQNGILGLMLGPMFDRL